MNPQGMKASQEQAQLQKKKEEEAKRKSELNNLFRPAQTVSKGRLQFCSQFTEATGIKE